MKKLFYPAIFALPLFLASCGGAGEEIPIHYGSERSELEGNPSTVKETIIDYEDVKPGRSGKVISEH
ncbi:MAG: hypothetical protein LUE10_09060, partial [Alistipes sp.]|nr:hypothetical protein [Alistipes sp.]